MLLRRVLKGLLRRALQKVVRRVKSSEGFLEGVLRRVWRGREGSRNLRPPLLYAPMQKSSKRYPSYDMTYRTMLVAIVSSQDSFVFFFFGGGGGYRAIVARYVAKWGIGQMCLCKTRYQGRVSHHFGRVLTSLKKYRVIWGITAIVSQYRAIWGH